MAKMTVLELILLNEDTYKICGWKGGNNFSIEYKNESDNDIHYYQDIHNGAFEESKYDVRGTLDSIFERLENIWGPRAAQINIFDKEPKDGIIKYYVDITLAETM
jgi:hypothetical protein